MPVTAWADTTNDSEAPDMTRSSRPGHRYLPVLALTAVTALTVSACGGDSADPDSGSADASSSGESRITESWGLEPVQSVVDLVPAEWQDTPIPNAVYNDYPPQDYLEGDTLVGIQIDFMTALSEVMGVEFSNESIGNFDSLIPGLQSGRYEISSADFGITADRLGAVDFVSQFAIGTGFAVKEGSDITISDASDLCGHSIGVIAGSYFIDQVEAASDACEADGDDPIELQTYPNDGARTLAVTNGRADITATGADALAFTIATDNVALVLQDYVYEPTVQGIAIADGSELGPALLAGIQELVTDGTYADILEKWDISSAGFDSADEVTLYTDASQAP